MLSMGLIPHLNDVHYGYLRDRVKADGGTWLQPELRKFFDEKLEDSNELDSTLTQGLNPMLRFKDRVVNKVKRTLDLK